MIYISQSRISQKVLYNNNNNNNEDDDDDDNNNGILYNNNNNNNNAHKHAQPLPTKDDNGCESANATPWPYVQWSPNITFCEVNIIIITII